MQLKLIPGDDEDGSEKPWGGKIDPAYRSKVSIAAQYFVAADILQRGWNCSIAAEGLRYDLIADINGLRRVQVKMSMYPRLCSVRATTISYPFGGGPNGGLAAYLNDIDLFAFVAMDIRKIIYLHPKQADCNSILFPRTKFEGDEPNLSWDEVIKAWVDSH